MSSVKKKVMQLRKRISEYEPSSKLVESYFALAKCLFARVDRKDFEAISSGILGLMAEAQAESMEYVQRCYHDFVRESVDV